MSKHVVPRTNSQLARKATSGVARRAQHLIARARCPRYVPHKNGSKLEIPLPFHPFRARAQRALHFGQNANDLKHNCRSSRADGDVAREKGKRMDRRVRRQLLRDTRIEKFDDNGGIARYVQQNQHHSLLAPSPAGRNSGWRDCSREPVGQCENVKIIHKTPFSGVVCTIFRRLWITLWISYRTSCAWVRDKSRIFPQGSKIVPSCSLDTRCLSIQFSIRQDSVYTTLTVVIHRNGLPLLTTTMYTYSKPIKTLKTDYERRENRKTRSARTVENAALAVRDPGLAKTFCPVSGPHWRLVLSSAADSVCCKPGRQ